MKPGQAVTWYAPATRGAGRGETHNRRKVAATVVKVHTSMATIRLDETGEVVRAGLDWLEARKDAARGEARHG